MARYTEAERRQLKQLVSIILADETTDSEYTAAVVQLLSLVKFNSTVLVPVCDAAAAGHDYEEVSCGSVVEFLRLFDENTDKQETVEPGG